MNLIDLSWWQLALAAALVVALAVATHMARLGVGRSLLVAAVRTTIQLALVGFVLPIVFATLTFIVLANGLREVLDVGSRR